MNNENTPDAVSEVDCPPDPSRSSGSSPPALPPNITAVPMSGALTGVYALDECVRQYRRTAKLFTELQRGLSNFGDARSHSSIQKTDRAEAIQAFVKIVDQFGWAGGEISIEKIAARICHDAVRSYVENGERCYEVAPGLAERLCMTELRGVMGEALCLPFNSIALVVPEEVRDLAHLIFLSVRTTTLPPSYGGGAPTSRRVLDIVTHRHDQKAIEVHHLTVDLERGDLRDAVSQALSGYELKVEGHYALDAKARVRQLFWWAVNVCLYITHSGAQAEAKHPNADAERNWDALVLEPRPRRRQRLLNRYNSKFRQRIYLGRSVQPLAIPKGSRGPTTVRTLVAGHWRNQVCGPRRQDRRLIWIEPFWRGLSSGPISNPVRVVTKERVEQSHASQEAA